MRFLKLLSNPHGRDFIVGDIHGCYYALMWLLDKVNFDRSVDRLFSVGDIIDRGPDSELCLQLIFEPWFFMVRGNHENMYCDAVYNRTTFMHRSDYFKKSNGGVWTKPWFARNAPELGFWAQKLETLPYVIQVEEGEGTSGFWVVHAELRSQTMALTDQNIESFVSNFGDDELGILQWSRKISKRLPVAFPTSLRDPVYCGHNPAFNPPDIAMGHWNLDGGAGKWTGPGAFSDVCLVMMCHQTGEVFRKDVSGDIYLGDI